MWAKLTAGLAGLAVPCPSEKALRDLRRRLGPAPLKALFEVVAGPLAQPRTPGVRFRGLRTVAFDGCNSLKVPDTDRNRSWLGRIRYRMGFAGYPTLRLMTLVETGTRGLLGAALGSAGDRDEATLARRLLPLLQPGMLRAARPGLRRHRLPRRGRRHRGDAAGPQQVHPQPAGAGPALPDGSYLSDLDGLTVRIIEADLTVTGADGSRVRDRYRLITTLLDHRPLPGGRAGQALPRAVGDRVAYLALRHTLLDGHVLRSGDRPGLEQEIWALLTLYQLLRMAMVTAVETRPGTNPDRASFTTALQAARDQLTAAPGILPRRPPTRPTCSASSAAPSWPPCCPPAEPATAPARSNAPPPATSTATTRPRPPTTITASTSPCTPQPRPDLASPTPQATATRTPAPTRRERITTIMQHRPHRGWTGRELADQLAIKPRNMLTQLAEWTRLGFLTRTGAGTYASRHAATPPVLDQPGFRPTTRHWIAKGRAAPLRPGNAARTAPRRPLSSPPKSVKVDDHHVALTARIRRPSCETQAP